MNFIEKLTLNSTNPQELTSFNKTNFRAIYDFFGAQCYDELVLFKTEIDDYIAGHIRIIRNLDLRETVNVSFITLLLDVSERFGFIYYFQRFYSLLKNSEIGISKRLEASSFYLTKARTFTDLENNYDSFLTILDDAVRYEEDDTKSVVNSFLNYYNKVVEDFGAYNTFAVKSLNERIRKSIPSYYYLKDQVVEDVLAVDIVNFEEACISINHFLDGYLNRGKAVYQFIDTDYLIEKDSSYSAELAFVSADFNAIRELSVEKFNLLENRNEIFSSLGRGVEILESEKQLFSYMNSFGKMHAAKLRSAFEFLPRSIFDDSMEVIDWGCGQGFGSMVFLDYFFKKGYPCTIDKSTLIEPSEVALKRAALHVQKYEATIDVLTIHKDLNSLKKNDFYSGTSQKLHIFSNILDIDDFSMVALMEMIQETFTGENYFIVASPYITDLKTRRIQNFMEGFQECIDFEIFASIEERSGEWQGTRWSRVIKVFKATI